MADKGERMRGRSFRTSDELWADARATADERGDDLSEVLRVALRRYVARHRRAQGGSASGS